MAAIDAPARNPGSFGNSGSGAEMKPSPMDSQTDGKPLTGGSAGGMSMAAGSGGSTAMQDPGGMSSADGGSPTGAPGSAACPGTRYTAQLALHLVLDESLTTTVPVDLWSPLSEALDGWLTSDTMASTQVAVQMFAAACEESAYATPTLALAPASEQQAALGSLMKASTHGFGAATAPALQGALNSAQQWAQSGAGNAAVLLISSSQPLTCGGASTDGAMVAAAALTGTPAVPTYVLALQPHASLDGVAEAGGTGSARSADDSTSADSLLEAMRAITDEARCRYALPAGAAAYVPDGVVLELTVNGTVTTVARVDSAAQCDAALGGWYYDDASAPRFLIACEQTCSQIRDGGQVQIGFGCGVPTP